MAKKLILLGATGSIGASAVDVVRTHPGDFRIVAVSARRSRERCEAIAREFGAKAYVGEDAAVRAVEENDADVCLVATVGMSGLKPTVVAIEKGMDIALATKEVMVMAGEKVTALAKAKGVRFLPVDSEHSAIFQCLGKVKSKGEEGENAEGSGPKLIANIWGGSVEEYAEVAERMGDKVDAIEMNVSCPNVKAGGHTFGQDPKILNEVVSAVRQATKLPLIVKLAPNVPSIVPYVKACEDAGADALSMINTIPAMVIDIEKRVPVLANRTGGLSGRGIHPAAVKLVYDAHKATKLPILAMGGVYEAKDAIEFLLAGATAVAVGTATFTNPSTVAEVYDGIVAYCEKHGFKSVAELTGNLVV